MNLRDYIGAVSRASAERGMSEDRRRLLVGAAKLARSNPADLLKALAGIGRQEKLHDRELDTWAEPEEIEYPEGRKRFDVCDLRIWLRIAQGADVPAIPAREVARLDEDELGALLGKVALPGSLRTSLANGLRAGVKEMPDEVDESELAQFFESFARARPAPAGPASAQAGPEADGRKAWEKIESALDEIPSSWMVRTQYAGSGNLKALVGTGLMQKADDTARVRPDFELGGGWVRAGNRRLIDFSDPRFLSTGIGGHKPVMVYLARPWAQPARYHEGEDLHRANSPLAGPGKWPAEWRVFVRAGQVSGVANYYAWTGQGATPENAWNAIRAGMLGQRMVDHAEALGLTGHYMDQVFIRNAKRDTRAIELLDRDWPEDRMHCTLDFLETGEGLQFLEGGPAHMPGGGGHPCAFAGQGTDPGIPCIARCEGVAFNAMPHVHLAEPETWVDGEPGEAIKTWARAAELAAEHADIDAETAEFLERRCDPTADADASFAPE